MHEPGLLFLLPSIYQLKLNVLLSLLSLTIDMVSGYMAPYEEIRTGRSLLPKNVQSKGDNGGGRAETTVEGNNMGNVSMQISPWRCYGVWLQGQGTAPLGG